MGSDDTVQVLISSDTGLTWTALETWDVNNEPPTLGQTYTIDLSAYTGTSYIFAIWATDGSVNDIEDYDFHIGNFSIQQAPPCSIPTALSSSNLTTDSASLSWTENGTAVQWEISYGSAGFTPGTGTQVVANANPFNLTGLTSNTAYDWYVRAICGVGDTSNWSDSSSFTTLACLDPTALSSANVSVDSASLSWTENGSAIQWEISYGSTGFTAGSGTQIIANTNPFNLLNLNPNTSYDWYVRSICGSGDTSNWSDTAVFTTLPPPLPNFPYYPVGIINTEDATTGISDSLNVDVATSGIVMGTDLDGNNGYIFTIIDLSSGSQEGIGIFSSSDIGNYQVTQGDSISVYGSVSQFNGLTQVSIDTLVVEATGVNEPSPIIVNFASAGTESKWIQINNLVSLGTSGSAGSNATIAMERAGDTTDFRVDRDTDVDDSLAIYPIAVGDTLCSVIGIGGQFTFGNIVTEGYQIIPARFSDIDTTNCSFTVGIENEAEAAAFTLYPNPTKGQFIIETSGFTNAAIRVMIRDISGRIILEENILNANSSFRKSFNLNGEAKGIYFISILDGNNVINEKLIVQ